MAGSNRDVYVDGSCTRNGQSGAKAGYGVYFGPGHSGNVSAPVHDVRPTNNNAEIQGATRAIREASQMGYSGVNIKTDSRFLIDSTTKWMPNWKQNGWVTSNNQPVKNQESLRELDNAISRSGMDVRFEHVRGHSGNPGNMAADRLAKEGASKYNSRYY